MFLYLNGRPESGLMDRDTSAVTEPRFCTVEPQWDTWLIAIVVGEQVFVRVTAPCFRTNATGMNTGFAPEAGTSLIEPKYWPFATAGALIVIGKVSVAPFATVRLRFLFPTVIVTPAGADTCTCRFCFRPDTLMAVRCVVIEPVIVVA